MPPCYGPTMMRAHLFFISSRLSLHICAPLLHASLLGATGGFFSFSPNRKRKESARGVSRNHEEAEQVSSNAVVGGGGPDIKDDRLGGQRPPGGFDHRSSLRPTRPFTSDADASVVEKQTYYSGPCVQSPLRYYARIFAHAAES